MKAAIIAGGVINNYDVIKNLISDFPFIICADHGFDHAINMNIMPNLVVGDMDSVVGDISNVNKKVYPKDKDFSDTELAILHAFNLGFLNISLFAAIGDRVDHSLSNLLLMDKFTNLNVNLSIHNEECSIFAIKRSFETITKIKTTVSLIPVRDCTYVKTYGLKYPLNNENLKVGTTRGISNIASSQNIKITIKSGCLLAFIERA